MRPRQFLEVPTVQRLVDDAPGITTGSSAFTNDRVATRFSLHDDIADLYDILGTVMNVHIIDQVHNAEMVYVAIVRASGVSGSCCP